MPVGAFSNGLLICPLRIAASPCSAIDELLAVEFQYSLRLIEPPLIRTRVWRHSNAAGPHHRRVQYQSAAWRAFGRVWCYPSRNKARICKGARVGRVHAPFAAIIRDGLEMNEFGQNRSRRFRAPAR